MESCKSIGEAEECDSSESGWTMYIGSPMDNTEDANGDGEVEDEEEEIYDEAIYDYGKDYESDDSMASDASSRPLDCGKIGDGKYLDNKVVGRNGSKFKKPVDVVPVKKNMYGDSEKQNLGARN